MIKRFLSKQITERLSYFPALALLGPRQVGKTTLAKQIALEISTDIEYIDLEFAVSKNSKMTLVGKGFYMPISKD